MEMIRDDYIIRSIENTGYPPWAQRMIEDFPQQEEEPEEYLTETEGMVLTLIGTGKKNAVRRQELCEKTGLSDRHVRQAIESLRRDYIILNDQDGMGYYRPADTDEVIHGYWQELARAMSIMRRLRPMRYVLKRGGHI